MSGRSFWHNHPTHPSQPSQPTTPSTGADAPTTKPLPSLGAGQSGAGGDAQMPTVPLPGHGPGGVDWLQNAPTLPVGNPALGYGRLPVARPGPHLYAYVVGATAQAIRAVAARHNVPPETVANGLLAQNLVGFAIEPGLAAQVAQAAYGAGVDPRDLLNAALAQMQVDVRQGQAPNPFETNPARRCVMPLMRGGVLLSLFPVLVLAGLIVACILVYVLYVALELMHNLVFPHF